MWSDVMVNWSSVNNQAKDELGKNVSWFSLAVADIERSHFWVVNVKSNVNPITRLFPVLTLQ